MKYSKLSNYRIKRILQYFCDELTAVQTAKQLNLHRNTTDRYYDIFRTKIAAYQEQQKQKFRGNIEIDESYFGKGSFKVLGMMAKEKKSASPVWDYFQKQRRILRKHEI